MNLLLALTIVFAPAYVIKFELLGFPTNLLMVWIIVIWSVFGLRLTIEKKWNEFADSVNQIDKKILVLIVLFFSAGIISLFTHGFEIKKLGQFIVLFLQPISLFFIYRYQRKEDLSLTSRLLLASYAILTFSGLYAMIQYFMLVGLPSTYWGNSEEPKRALSFFIHPNFYALFIAPLLAFLLPDALKEFSFNKFYANGISLRQISKIWKPIAWIIGAFGLLLSLSRAGWIGLTVSAALYVLIAGNKTIRRLSLVIVIITFIAVASVPTLRYRAILPFKGEKSAVSRLSLWNTGIKAIKESPITGLGLTGFSQNWNRINTDPNLDSHNFPHNIFLNFWVETGLLGLISFTLLCLLIITKGLKNKTNALALGVSLFLITILVQGQLDNPYLKNDLAIIFWLVLSFAI